MTNAIHHIIKESTKVIVGASAVFSNGDVMSRIGTSVVTMAAHDSDGVVRSLQILRYCST